MGTCWLLTWLLSQHSQCTCSSAGRAPNRCSHTHAACIIRGGITGRDTTESMHPQHPRGAVGSELASSRHACTQPEHDLIRVLATRFSAFGGVSGCRHQQPRITHSTIIACARWSTVARIQARSCVPTPSFHQPAATCLAAPNSLNTVCSRTCCQHSTYTFAKGAAGAPRSGGGATQHEPTIAS